MGFGDYIVYVDESGDHGLVSINAENPVFVLTFCIFHKDAYRTQVVPAVQSLKFDFWGHDGVILHTHEIRKARGDFAILLNAETRSQFMTRMNALIEAMPVTLVAAAIDKNRHVRQYKDPANPYEIALVFCMERLQRWLEERGQLEARTFIMVECRGAREDASLELEFRRIADGKNTIGPMPNLDIRFMDKRHNSAGLQVADLLAHPVHGMLSHPTNPTAPTICWSQSSAAAPLGGSPATA